MTTQTLNQKFSQNNPRAWRNPWVIGWISLVLVVVIVNIFMISLAFITSPGLVVEDYYEQGRDHEKNINKKLSAWNALGWTVQNDFPQRPTMQRSEIYRISLVDKQGLPLNSANIILKAYRPSDAAADFSIKMQQVQSGVYEAEVNFMLKGAWELNVYIEHNNDSFQTSSDLFVLVP